MHINKNMEPSLLAGIEAGERAVGLPGSEKQYQTQLQIVEDLHPRTIPTGDRPFPVGAFIPARRIAFAQGFIAAYRSAGEER